MRTKWFIIALILVVLPAVILTVLAARAIGHYELIMQAEVEQDASRVLSAIDSAVHEASLHTLEKVRLSLASVLGPAAGTERLEGVCHRLARENGGISKVYVFMNPWGFLASSDEKGESGETGIEVELLANTLRKHLVDRDRRLSESDTVNPRRSRERPLTFTYGGSACFFARMPGTASVWAGYTMDQVALTGLLDQALSEYSAAGMVLSYKTVAARSDVASSDVEVSDSLSPAIHMTPETFDEDVSDLPLLASRFLMEPLKGIELIARAAPGVEIEQIARARTRLYAWGLAVVLAWVLLGIGTIVRQTLVEIHEARQRGEFLLGVSHDLRTPLASMRMLAESLAHGNVRKKEQPRFLHTIVSECDRLSGLIERVLYLVRYGQGALIYCQREIDMGALVQDSVAELKAYADSLQLKIEPDLPLIHGDRAALQQVVLNLLDNAIKYGKRSKQDEKEGEEDLAQRRDDAKSEAHSKLMIDHSISAPLDNQGVRVEVAVDSVRRRRHMMAPMRDWVRVVVRDFGMGIARREQRRIFRRFYRSSRAHDRNVSGVGLGLALCRHVIRSHGGWIEVESTVGSCTTFSVYLRR